MVLTDKWFTALSENEDGTYTFISGRSDIEEFIASGKMKERIEVTWTYTADNKGLPADDAEAELMEAVEERLRLAMEKDKLAILTGIYTGSGKRQWIYIARNTAAFGTRLNETLIAAYPDRQLPIAIYAEKDPENQEYKELLELKQEED
jgi:hypothetical protein